MARNKGLFCSSEDYNMEAKINIANKEHVNNRDGDLNSDGHKL